MISYSLTLILNHLMFYASLELKLILLINFILILGLGETRHPVPWMPKKTWTGMIQVAVGLYDLVLLFWALFRTRQQRFLRSSLRCQVYFMTELLLLLVSLRFFNHSDYANVSCKGKSFKASSHQLGSA